MNDCAREYRAQACNGDDHHVNDVNDDIVNDVSYMDINLNRLWSLISNLDSIL